MGPCPCLIELGPRQLGPLVADNWQGRSWKQTAFLGRRGGGLGNLSLKRLSTSNIFCMSTGPMTGLMTPLCQFQGGKMPIYKLAGHRAENTVNKTTCQQLFHGIVLGLFWYFLGILFREGQHTNNFDPHPFPAQSRKNVCVYFSLVDLS